MDFFKILMQSDQLFGPDGMNQLYWAGGIGVVLGLIIGIWRKSGLLALVLAIVFGGGAAAYWASVLYAENDRDKQVFFERRYEASVKVDLPMREVRDDAGTIRQIPDISDLSKVPLKLSWGDTTSRWLGNLYQKYGVTRVYGMGGPRGKWAIPFDLVTTDGEYWYPVAFEGFESQIIQAGSTPPSFYEGWMLRQFALYSQNLWASAAYWRIFPAEALTDEQRALREIPANAWSIELWAPEKALYEVNEKLRLEGTARDQAVQRAIFSPFGKKLPEYERDPLAN